MARRATQSDQTAADVLVIFGITGDLARVMTFHSLYRLEKRAVQGLHEAGLTDTCRVVVEKPFGHDLASATALAKELHHYVRESQQVSLCQAMPPADPAHYVRGQYDGYLDIDGVRPGSTTETYAAFRLEFDNWRWSGVPFLIRAGKKLPIRQTEFRIVFQRPPKLAVQRLGTRRPEPDQLVVRPDPSAGLRLRLDARGAEAAEPKAVTLDHDFGREGGARPTPDEVLLYAALHGDPTRFGRQDGVEQRRRVIQPLVDAPPPVETYAPGTWGPAGADRVPAGRNHWERPWSSE